MAMPYPEGEVFFDRKVLSQPKAGYDASNPKDFYSHFMIEYVWNIPAYHGSKNANSTKTIMKDFLGKKFPYLIKGAGHKHRRSGYKVAIGDAWATEYGNWTDLPISYGPEQGDIKRRVQHNLCTSGNRFRNYEWGDSAEVRFLEDVLRHNLAYGPMYLPSTFTQVLVHDFADAEERGTMGLD